MKSKLTQLLGLWALALLLCAPMTLQAQEEEEPQARPNLADLWVAHVKAGHEGEFETQLKAHIAARKDAGDPRAWRVVVPVIGDDMGHYIIRHCCSDWAAQDAYAEWSRNSKMNEHWNANVHPHVASYEHYMTAIDYDNGHWPAEDPGFKYFGVSRWDVKPGGYAAMDAARVELSKTAKEHGWPRYWSWSNAIGGSGGLALVSPYLNYAGMAPPEQGFAAFVAEHLGAEKAGEVLSAFSSNLKHGSYTVYRLREDLSME